MFNNISLKQSVEEYLCVVKNRRRKAKTAYRDARSALLGKPGTPTKSKSSLTSKVGGGSIRYFKEVIGIHYAANLTVDNLIEYDEIMWEECEQCTRNKKFSQLRQYLEWAIKQKHVTLAEEDITNLQQKEYFPPKAELPPSEFIILLSKRNSRAYKDENPFLNLRNYLMLYFCCCCNGIRPGIEVCELNIEDLDLTNCEITVIRKFSKKGALRKQTIAFRKDFFPIISEYISEREKRLSFYPDVIEDKNALFIKDNPEIGGNKSWRLDEASFSKIFKNAVEQSGVPSHRAYLMRHASVTNQVSNGRLFGIDVNEVALRNDHSVNVCLKYYNDIIRSGVEFLTRDPDDLAGFLESIATYHLKQFLAHPNLIRHYAAWEEVKQILGKLQLYESLKAYRKGELADFNNETDLKSLQTLLKHRVDSNENSSGQELIGRLMRKNFFNIQ